MLTLTNFIFVDHNKPLLISEQPYNINKHGFSKAKSKTRKNFCDGVRNIKKSGFCNSRSVGGRLV